MGGMLCNLQHLQKHTVHVSSLPRNHWIYACNYEQRLLALNVYGDKSHQNSEETHIYDSLRNTLKHSCFPVTTKKWTYKSHIRIKMVYFCQISKDAAHSSVSRFDTVQRKLPPFIDDDLFSTLQPIDNGRNITSLSLL